MSTLTSSSTLAQIEAAYDDNASYREDNSVSKARAFGTACIFLARRREIEAQSGGERYRGESLKAEGDAAFAWAAANDTARHPRVTFLDRTLADR